MWIEQIWKVFRGERKSGAAMVSRPQTQHGKCPMRKRLDDEDRRAVDLLLERPNGVGDTPPVEQLFRAPVGSGFERRLDAAEAVLSLLDRMPADDPPPDLVANTLQRIREIEEGEKPRVVPPRPAYLNN